LGISRRSCAFEGVLAVQPDCRAYGQAPALPKPASAKAGARDSRFSRVHCDQGVTNLRRTRDEKPDGAPDESGRINRIEMRSTVTRWATDLRRPRTNRNQRERLTTSEGERQKLRILPGPLQSGAFYAGRSKHRVSDASSTACSSVIAPPSAMRLATGPAPIASRRTARTRLYSCS